MQKGNLIVHSYSLPSRRAATDRNGGRAEGGELYKLTITDGWQWKAPPWDLERSVV